MSQLQGELRGGISSGVLSQALCPCRGSAGAWGWVGNALCSWGWCKQISSNLTIPKAYLNLGLTRVSKRKVLYLIRFYSQKKKSKYILGFHPSAKVGGLSPCPWQLPAHRGSAGHSSDQGGTPQSWLPKRFPGQGICINTYQHCHFNSLADHGPSW